MKSDSCAKNGRFSQKPRPGLRGKTSRYRSALRIRDGQPGRLFGADDVSAARRIDQWFLRVGGSTGESAVEIRFVSDRQNSCDPPPLERNRCVRDVVYVDGAVCKADRSGAAAKCCFHRRGVSSATRLAG